MPEAEQVRDDDEVPAIMHRATAEHGFEVFELVPAKSAEHRAAARATSSSIIYLADLPLLRARVTLVGRPTVPAVAIGTRPSACRALRWIWPSSLGPSPT
ncbi:MAG: hypothetical protein QNK90_10845 [Opitutaceae bacterium]